MPINKNHEPRSEYTLQPNEKVAICRCWQSSKFPFCDGAHRCFNDENQDQLGPMIICGHQYQKPE